VLQKHKILENENSIPLVPNVSSLSPLPSDWPVNLPRYHIASYTVPEIRGGPKNNRNLNLARELEVVARCAAKCRESTQYYSSLPGGVNLG